MGGRLGGVCNGMWGKKPGPISQGPCHGHSCPLLPGESVVKFISWQRMHVKKDMVPFILPSKDSLTQVVYLPTTKEICK